MPNAQPTTKELIAMLYERLPELFERSQQKPLTDERPAQQALDKMAENARELGLDYEPVQEPVAWMDRDGDLYANEPDKNWCPPHYPLYTTPPAQPAPDLQAELEATNRQVEILSDALAESRREIAQLKAQPAVPDAFGTREGEHPQYIQGWNDCRAEMLRERKS